MMDNKRKDIVRRKSSRFIGDMTEFKFRPGENPNRFYRRKEEVDRYRQEILLKAELESAKSDLIDVDKGREPK